MELRCYYKNDKNIKGIIKEIKNDRAKIEWVLSDDIAFKKYDGWYNMSEIIIYNEKIQ